MDLTNPNREKCNHGDQYICAKCEPTHPWFKEPSTSNKRCCNNCIPSLPDYPNCRNISCKCHAPTTSNKGECPKCYTEGHTIEECIVVNHDPTVDFLAKEASKYNLDGEVVKNGEVKSSSEEWENEQWRKIRKDFFVARSRAGIAMSDEADDFCASYLLSQKEEMVRAFAEEKDKLIKSFG